MALSGELDRSTRGEDLDSTQSCISMLENEFRNLRSERDDAVRRNEKLEATLSQNVHDLLWRNIALVEANELAEHHKQMLASLADENSKKDELLEKLKSLEEKLDNAQRQVAEKSAALDDKEAEVALLSDQLGKNDLSILQTTVDSLKIEKDEALKKCSDLEDKIAKNVETLLYRNLDLVEAIEELERLKSKQGKSRTDVSTNYQKKLDGLTAELSSAKRDSEFQSQRVLSSEAVIMEKEEEIKLMQAKLAEKVPIISSSQEAQNDGAVKDHQVLLEKLADKQEALLWKTLSLVEANESIDILKAKVEQKETEAFCYAQKLDTLYARLSDAEASTVHNTDLLSTQIMTTKALQDENRVLAERLIGKSAFVENEKARYENIISNLKLKVEEAQSQSVEFSSVERSLEREAELSGKLNELLRVQNEAAEVKNLLKEQTEMNAELVRKMSAMEKAKNEAEEKLEETECAVVEKSVELISDSVLLKDRESNIEELMKKLAKLEEASSLNMSQVTSEKEKREELEITLADRDNTISMLTANLSQLEAASKAKSDEVAALQCKLNEYSNTVHAFPEELKAAQDANIRISAQLECAFASLRDKEAEIESLAKEKEEITINLNDMSSQNDSLRKEVESSARNCEVLQHEALKTEITLEKQRQECAAKNEEIAKLRALLETEIAVKEGKLNELSENLARYEEQLNEKASCEATLANLLSEKDVEIGRLYDQIVNNAKDSEVMQRKLDALEKELTISQANLVSSNSVVNDLESKIRSMQAASSSSEQKIIELTESLEAQILDRMQAEENLEKLKEEIGKMNEQIRELQASLVKANQANEVHAREMSSHQTTIDQLKMQIEALKAEKEKLQDSLDTKEGEYVQSVDELQTDLNRKIKELAEVNDQLIEASSKLKCVEAESESCTVVMQDKMKHLEEQLNEQTQKCMEFEASLSAANEANEKLNQEFVTSKSAQEQLKEENQKLHEAIAEQRENFATKESAFAQSVEELREGVRLKSVEIGKITSELASKLATIEAQSAKSAESHQLTIKKLEETLRTKSDELEGLKALLSETKATSDERLEAITAKENDFKKLEDQIVNLQANMSEMATKEEEYVKSIADLLKDTEAMTNELGDAQARVDKLSSELEAVEAESVKCAEGLRETIKGHEAQIAKLSADAVRLAEERDSRVSKIKLLLNNQKKMECQLEKASKQYEDLASEKAELEKRVADRDALEEEISSCHKRIVELEAELNQEVAVGELPWEVDPELKDLTPMELRSILAGELTSKEMAKLNEVCVVELEKDLKVKTSLETAHVWEISSLKKELQKCRMRLGHLESQRSAVRAALREEKEAEPSNPLPQQGGSAKKRRSAEALGTTPRVTRSRSSKSTISDNGENEEMATKKQKRDTSTLFSSHQDNGLLRSKQQRKVQLDKSMPENPFTLKASTIVSGIQAGKRPLETITNRARSKDD